MSDSQVWVILVGQYGSYKVIGTIEEAEEARSHKANWEHAVAKKRLADAEDEPSVSDCWNHPGFGNKFWYFCECGRCDNDARIRAALYPTSTSAGGVK
jgi:hypothetical protein